MSKASWQDTPVYRALLARLKRDMPSGGLPGLTSVEETPWGDQGLVDGQGGWLNLAESPVDPGLELAVGGGSDGNIATGLSAFSRSDGGSRGTVSVYSSDTEFTQEADFLAGCWVYPGVGQAAAETHLQVFQGGRNARAATRVDVDETSSTATATMSMTGDRVNLLIEGDRQAGLSVTIPEDQVELPFAVVKALQAAVMMVWPNGDVEITDPTAGVILRASDGSRHRITVAPNGTLSTTVVSS